MKRIFAVLAAVLWFAVGSFAQAPAGAASSAPAQPVFLFLYARVTDHVNLDTSEDRVRHVLPEVEKLGKEHPEQHVKATLLLSGSVSDAFEQRNAKTHIKDYIQDYVKRGVVEVGYDGADEPTYKTRPQWDVLRGKPLEDRWAARVQDAEKFLTEGRDPLTGAPKPGTSGGLKREQEVFGPAVCITGLTGTMGGDAELVHVLARYNKDAILFGIPYANPAKIPGFRGSAMEFSRQMSPLPNTSPELFWQDDRLRTSERSDPLMNVVTATDGPDAFKAFVTKLDRAKVRIVHVELGSEQLYYKADFVKGDTWPALKYAYEHTSAPQVPLQQLRKASEIKDSWDKESALLTYLAKEFVPANAQSRFVSSTALREMTPPPAGFAVSAANVQDAAKDLLHMWGTDPLIPFYSKYGQTYLSPADTYQVLADALAEKGRTGKLPESVNVIRVYGPIAGTLDHGPNVGQVPVSAITQAAAQISKQLHDTAWSPLPKNSIPTWTTVGDTKVNAAQFLKLMAQAVLASSSSEKLDIKMEQMASAPLMAYPQEIPREERSNSWTFKPAPLMFGQMAATQ